MKIVLRVLIVLTLCIFSSCESVEEKKNRAELENTANAVQEKKKNIALLKEYRAKEDKNLSDKDGFPLRYSIEQSWSKVKVLATSDTIGWVNGRDGYQYFLRLLVGLNKVDLILNGKNQATFYFIGQVYSLNALTNNKYSLETEFTNIEYTYFPDLDNITSRHEIIQTLSTKPQFNSMRNKSNYGQKWNDEMTKVIKQSNIFKYIGERDFLDGNYGGQGNYKSSNGDKYFGELYNGEKNGHGTFTYDNGAKYVGEWNNDERDGQGTHTFSDSDKYVGEWKNGNMNGHGTFTYSDGGKYVGYFLDGNYIGQGTKTYPDGGKYVGEWKNNDKNGQGTFTYSDGGKYVGEWKNGNINGHGTFTYNNGAKYVGYFFEGIYYGQGIFTYDNGEKYVGEWENGKKNGQGTYTYSDGGQHIGEWKNGVFIK